MSPTSAVASRSTSASTASPRTPRLASSRRSAMSGIESRSSKSTSLRMASARTSSSPSPNASRTTSSASRWRRASSAMAWRSRHLCRGSAVGGSSSPRREKRVEPWAASCESASRTRSASPAEPCGCGSAASTSLAVFELAGDLSGRGRSGDASSDEAPRARSGSRVASRPVPRKIATDTRADRRSPVEDNEDATEHAQWSFLHA